MRTEKLYPLYSNRGFFKDSKYRILHNPVTAALKWRPHELEYWVDGCRHNVDRAADTTNYGLWWKLQGKPLLIV